VLLAMISNLAEDEVARTAAPAPGSRTPVR
jgi:hypothetical protein